jgi:pimeloyl-ACP methyl ester carboxylesterase
MKYIQFILLSFIFAVSVNAQSQTVSFIHGFGDVPQIWNDMSDELLQDFDFSPYDVSYNTAQAISTSASSVFIPQSVAVAHSQGGLLSREYLRQSGTSNLDALITVGTPHLGAPIISNAQANNLSVLIDWWIDDLMKGPELLWGETQAFSFVSDVIGAMQIVGQYGLENYVSGLTASAASLTDMKPGSSFLNTLNSSPNSTLPSARYAIFGSEDPYGYVRLGDSAVQKGNTGNPIESGLGIDVHSYLSAVWLSAAISTQGIAIYYYWMYNDSDISDPLHFYYFDQYVKYQAASGGFAWGFLSLRLFQQLDYEVFMVGSLLSNQVLDESDAFIPSVSQAPGFFGSFGDRILRAEGANHLELTHHPNSEERIQFAFSAIGVPTPPPPPPPLSVSISGQTYIDSGQQGTWTANPEYGSESYSYDWFIRNSTSDPWTQAGTDSETFNWTFHNNTNAIENNYIKVNVISGSEQASSEITVTVAPSACEPNEIMC